MTARVRAMTTRMEPDHDGATADEVEGGSVDGGGRDETRDEH
jgi:hypothetical protein